MSSDEIRALRLLREDGDIVILPADKGNSTVVLNTQDYEEKASTLLNSQDYEKLKKGPHHKDPIITE